MSDKDENGSGPERSSPLGPEAIDELYRLAEILMGPTHADDRGTLSRRRVAKLRMDELLRSLDSPDAAHEEPFATHKWVLDVLQDLAAYAEERNLAELHRILMDARYLAFHALKDR
ncbi:hypothetical protein [Sedimentitalea arenosa]|uniref:Uncharacterized protein n=1 Tax=Sedimentitalea arenosa TaxID=2798803 RepID=A0A8J7J3Y4_9RHOB|nr:hypothetical protein [Arenibacterium arenosum]MBJ6371105.1 hypothetical protein [Arenibacterium arenosum]